MGGEAPVSPCGAVDETCRLAVPKGSKKTWPPRASLITASIRAHHWPGGVSIQYCIQQQKHEQTCLDYKAWHVLSSALSGPRWICQDFAVSVCKCGTTACNTYGEGRIKIDFIWADSGSTPRECVGATAALEVECRQERVGEQCG